MLIAQGSAQVVESKQQICAEEGPSIGPLEYFISEYPATKNYSPWERVAYVQLPNAIAYIVLSSRDKLNYQRDSGAVQAVLATFVYLEPNLAQTKSKSGDRESITLRNRLDRTPTKFPI